MTDKQLDKLIAVIERSAYNIIHTQWQVLEMDMRVRNTFSNVTARDVGKMAEASAEAAKLNVEGLDLVLDRLSGTVREN